MARLNPKGIALIAIILIIVIAAIMILGIGSFVSNSLRAFTAKMGRDEALFAAQAGVYAAVADYIQSAASPYWIDRRNVNIGANAYYSVGKSANFLLVDADYPVIFTPTGSATTYNGIQNIGIRNIHDNTSPGTITVNSVIVEWYNSTGMLTGVVLGGAQRWANPGGVVSGTTITLSPPFTLTPRASYTALASNQLIFSQKIPETAGIIITFYFSDMSSRKAFILNYDNSMTGNRSGNSEFSIISTGESRSAVNWKRTIEAAYDIAVKRLTSWKETENHI